MESMVFVFHPATGVHPIRAAYMAAYEASGFRYATRSEVERWYQEQELPPPRLFRTQGGSCYRLPEGVRPVARAKE